MSKYSNRPKNYFPILFVVVFITGCSSPSPKEPITANQEVSINSEQVGKIVFETNRDCQEFICGGLAIYSMDADGANLFQLTNLEGYDKSPQWSPDGSLIVFSSDRTREKDIYLMNSDGTDQKNLTADSGGESVENYSDIDSQPAWSPDGALIAFKSFRLGKAEIFVMNLDGTEVRRVTNTPTEDGSPAWSPDGSQIAYSEIWGVAADLYIVDIDGRNRRQLTAVREIGQSDSCPAWSPDGTKIAFMRIRNFDDDYDERVPDLFIMNADGSNQTLVLADAGCPTWSPDGFFIAFSSRREGNRDENSDIFVISRDGTGLINITNTPSIKELFPHWSSVP
jgi:TolB protein